MACHIGEEVEFFVRPLQGFPVVSGLGDVDHRGHDADRMTVGIFHDLCRQMDDEGRAVPFFHLKLSDDRTGLPEICQAARLLIFCKS